MGRTTKICIVDCKKKEAEFIEHSPKINQNRKRLRKSSDDNCSKFVSLQTAAIDIKNKSPW